MYYKAPILQGGKKPSGMGMGQTLRTTQTHSTFSGAATRTRSQRPTPHTGRGARSPSPPPIEDPLYTPAHNLTSTGSGRAKPKPLIKAAEFAAAIQEKLPPLPPITHMPHISLHTQPPHGVVLKPEKKSRPTATKMSAQGSGIGIGNGNGMGMGMGGMGIGGSGGPALTRRLPQSRF
jgi:hypothetical protein